MSHLQSLTLHTACPTRSGLLRVLAVMMLVFAAGFALLELFNTFGCWHGGYLSGLGGEPHDKPDFMVVMGQEVTLQSVCGSPGIRRLVRRDIPKLGHVPAPRTLSPPRPRAPTHAPPKPR